MHIELDTTRRRSCGKNNTNMMGIMQHNEEDVIKSLRPLSVGQQKIAHNSLPQPNPLSSLTTHSFIRRPTAAAVFCVHRLVAAPIPVPPAFRATKMHCPQQQRHAAAAAAGRCRRHTPLQFLLLSQKLLPLSLLSLVLLQLLSFLPYSLACAPPPPPPPPLPESPPLFASNNLTPRQPANSRAFGEQIHRPPAPNEQQVSSTDDTSQNGQGGAIEHRASTASGPVRSPKELSCYDFDDKCRWRNMEGFLVDELDWYQGAGFLDENRLRLATGTHISPDGFYGITATDRVELSGTKGILVSDVIQCQQGQAELRFMYWTSPEVKITICVKSVLRLFPYFDYCSTPIENNDPGPAYVPLPDMGNDPLQIFIQAHNFVFNSAALQGGFAIIDNLEYYGQFCDSDQQQKRNLFAQSNTARSENVPRVSPLPKDSVPPESQGDAGSNSFVWGPVPIYNSGVEPVDGGPDASGFSSLLDWMLYGGGGGLFGINKAAEAANNTSERATAIATLLPPASTTLFELNSIATTTSNNNIFPTLLPPTAQKQAVGVGTLSTVMPMHFHPVFASAPEENPTMAQMVLARNRPPHPSAAGEPPSSPSSAGGIRSFRIVQQQPKRTGTTSSSREQEQQQPLQKTARLFGQPQLQLLAKRRALMPHLALLNKRKIEEEEEEEELKKRRGRMGEEVVERDETEEEERQQQQDGPRVPTMPNSTTSRDEADAEEEGDGRRRRWEGERGGGGWRRRAAEGEEEDGPTAEEPTFVEREEWVGRR